MAFAIMLFFASLQWLFQQRKPADAYSDTQASDHGLAEPVEAPQDSEKSDYEWVEDTDDQNFAALKHILQAPLHEAEEMSKEDKQNKLESNSGEMEGNEKKVKDDDMEYFLHMSFYWVLLLLSLLGYLLPLYCMIWL